MSKTSTPSISIKAICMAFGISAMCLHHWRRGSPNRPALPVMDTGDRSVLFSVPAVEKWAKANKVEIVMPLLAAHEMTTSGDPTAKPAAKAVKAPAVKAAPVKKVAAAKKATPVKSSVTKAVERADKKKATPGWKPRKAASVSAQASV